jgi:hypothetical protein
VENPILCEPQIRPLSPNVLPQMLQNFAVKLCVDSLALGDEFAMNNAADVEKHDEHGLFIATTLSQGHTRGSLFHLSVHDVITDYHT